MLVNISVLKLIYFCAISKTKNFPAIIWPAIDEVFWQRLDLKVFAPYYSGAMKNRFLLASVHLQSV